MKKLYLIILGILVSAFAVVTLLNKSATALNMIFANCFRPGIVSTLLTEASFNNLMRQAVGNNNIEISVSYSRPGSVDVLSINSVRVNGQPVSETILTHTENTHMSSDCSSLVWYSHASQSSAVFKLYNADGTESDYALRKDCANLIRYTPTPQNWQSEGETEILGMGTTPCTIGWTKGHPIDFPMEVRQGDTVRWRHRINVTNTTGSPTINLQLTTSQSNGVVGEGATWSNHPLTINVGEQPSTGWQERSWTMPLTVVDGDVFCQYWTWTPNQSPNPSTGSSLNNLQQCIEIIDNNDDLRLEGRIRIRPVGGAWSDVDITVTPGTCVEWEHTLTKYGPVAFLSAVHFQQLRTEDTEYSNANCSGQSGGLRSGSVPNLPQTTPFTVPIGNVRNFAVTVNEGDTMCQSLGWTAPLDSSLNGHKHLGYARVHW
jgi:hypothetical protein